MKITFPKKSNEEIIASIKNAMGGRSLSDLISLEDCGDEIRLKISKMGTSILVFSRTETAKDTELLLKSEKIAFAHKAFRDDVIEKFKQVIKTAGGTAS